MGQRTFLKVYIIFKNVFYSKSVYTVEVKNIKLQGYEIYNSKEYRAATSEDQSPLHYVLQTFCNQEQAIPSSHNDK